VNATAMSKDVEEVEVGEVVEDRTEAALFVISARAFCSTVERAFTHTPKQFTPYKKIWRSS
jgi:hypothetical protein